MAGNRLYILALLCIAGAAAWGGLTTASGPASSPDLLQEALGHLYADQHAQAERKAMALATQAESPDPKAWLIVATARQRRRQPASAVRAYRLFLSYCDSTPLREFVLAQIRLCEAAAKPRPRLRAASSSLSRGRLRELGRVSKTTYTESSEHFVVRARNAEVAKLVVRQAEVSLARICQVILAGQDYPHSVEINVWADRAEYAKHATDAPEWSGGNFSFRVKDGIVTRRIDLTQRDEEGRFDTVMLDRVLPHEMCHLVLREYFGDAGNPLFLNEGLAMMAESGTDNKRIELAGVAMAGKEKIPLAELLVRDRHDLGNPAVFYAQAFSLVSFLHARLTKDQFRDLLLHVKDGCSLADALERALYVPHKEGLLTSLATAWENYAIEQAQYLRALRGANALTFLGKG